MNKEEITCKIPNNQIHISKEKDEDCLIWISSKAINMANTIDELQQQNQKYKEVIDKAINDLNIIIDIVRELPLGSDCWIIDRLEANKSILKEVSE